MAYNNYGGYDQGGGGGNYSNNYSTTSYGAQGGAESGGFLPGSQDGAKKIERGNDSLRPLTIRQVHSAEEIHNGGETLLDGHEVSRIHLVAQVRTVTKQTIVTNYKFDDGTGTIEGRVWNDTGAPSGDEFGESNTTMSNSPDGAIGTGDWVRVMGQIKFVSGKRFVTVTNMKKVRDMNEVNYHLLDAVYVHLLLTRGPAEGAQDGNAAAAGENAMQGVQQSGYGGMNGGAGELKGVSNIAQRVYARLKQDQGNEGVHLELVARELNLKYEQVRRAADELYERSIVFTTVDDDTFAALDE